MNIKTASLSSAGGRRINDDTVRVISNGRWVRAFVGDGLGGYAGGAQASQAAASAVLDSTPEESLLSEPHLLAAAERANTAVRQLQAERRGTMKTTLVLLSIEDGLARWMHIGDSRLYHFRNGALLTQTMDHSVSQMAVLMGQIYPDQIRFHEDRNRVLRALGSENAHPDIAPTVPLVAGQDVFLLCTDGFWEYIYENEMEQLLGISNSPEDWLNRMEALLLSRVPGDNDNYTAAAIFC